MRCQCLCVVNPLHGDLEAGIDQAVKRLVAQAEVIDRAEQFSHGAAAYDDDARNAVPADVQLVKVSRLLVSEAISTQPVHFPQH